MRNPYNRHYEEFDEICVTKTDAERQAVMNFMMAWELDCHCEPVEMGSNFSRIVVQKGSLNKSELKEARDATSGILWALRLPYVTVREPQYDININPPY